jgi:molybdate/tungstate transport system ATP-binding protein
MLRLLNVAITLGAFKLNPVTINVDQHEYLIVIGRTASGKTTLLKTIAGAYRLASGKISIDDVDITSEPPERRNIAYVSQTFSLFDHMDVYGNIEFGLRSRGMSKPQRELLVNRIAVEVGAESLLNRLPETLSGGEQQRVSLARALVTAPKVLLLDEPLSMIDPESKGSIVRLLKAIPEKYNIPVIHVTHEWDEAYSLGSLVAVMHQGRIIELGEPEQIFNQPKNYYTAKLVGFDNVYKGVATLSNSGCTIELENGLKLKSHASISGSVYACVRPEQVKLSTNGANSLKGRVEEVFRERFGFRVIVNVGNGEVAALVRSKLCRGDAVTITIPEDSVYLIPISEV